MRPQRLALGPTGTTRDNSEKKATKNHVMRLFLFVYFTADFLRRTVSPSIRDLFHRDVNMAATLSDDEFQRLQTQLLDLRTRNYSLDEHCKRQSQEVAALRQHLEEKKKELSKANAVSSHS